MVCPIWTPSRSPTPERRARFVSSADHENAMRVPATRLPRRSRPWADHAANGGKWRLHLRHRAGKGDAAGPLGGAGGIRAKEKHLSGANQKPHAEPATIQRRTRAVRSCVSWGDITRLSAMMLLTCTTPIPIGLMVPVVFMIGVHCHA
jgi:hypothetical protein